MLKMFAFAQSWAMDAANAYESFKKREEGQTMAEYGVVLAVITLVVVVAITALSGRIKGAIDAVTAILPKG
jgi:Flp pilus assembly pilin Flp